MPLQVSSDKLKEITKEYGYIGDLDTLNAEMIENYVRKHYNLNDSWHFTDISKSNVNGIMMKVYHFNHSGRRIMQDKVVT